jgi:hypothetical protein
MEWKKIERNGHIMKKMAQRIASVFVNEFRADEKPKTWADIRADYKSRYGDRHKCMMLRCPKCGNYETCKCMTRSLNGMPVVKPIEEGLCDKCSFQQTGETGLEPYENVRPINASVKTWREIETEYDAKYGINHHRLSLQCVKCGGATTCRCSTPKTLEKGICYYCTGEIDRPEPLKFD